MRLTFLFQISGILKASIFGEGQQLKLDVPQVALDFQLQNVIVGLNRLQFGSILDVVQYFALYAKSLKYAKFRPAYDVTPKKNPRAWWKFAIDSVIFDVKDKRVRYSWAFIKQRKVERVAYMEIFDRKQRGKKLTPEQKKSLSALEEKLDYDGVHHFLFGTIPAC